MKNVDFARSVLILLVILYHSLLFWTGTWIFDDIAISAPVLGKISIWIGTFHTLALTAIAGYTYEYITEKRGGYHFSNLLMKKVKRLLIPCILMSIFWVLPLTSLVIDIDADYIINKFILGKSPAQLWFLLMLFDVFVLFYPIRLLLEKSKFYYLVFPALYVVCCVYEDASNNYYQIFTSLQYLSYFALGHIMYKYRTFLFENERCNLRQPYVLCTLVILHIAVYILYLLNIPRLGSFLMLYLHFGGCATAVAVLLFLGEKVNPKNKLLILLKDNSFALYLLHQQIIYFILYYLNGLLSPTHHAAVNFVVSLLLSMVISIVLHKSRIMRVYFLGEKK